MSIAFRAAMTAFAASTLICSRAVAADLTLGAYLAGTCNTCHHATDKDAEIPALAGWKEPKLISTLQAYRSGARTDALMHAVATSLSEEETTAVAQYFAAQEAAP